VLSITVVWAVLVALAGPVGDFPLNDDWAYGWTVKTLLDTGSFQLSDWTATNLLPQALWGALFSLPFGFSFTALRLSTLVLGLVGVLATYGILRQVRADPATSLLGALLVALNPLYFALSHSFSNDVPSLAFALTAVYFLLRGLGENAPVNLGLGIAAALIATMNRQSGIVILPVFGLALLLKRGFRFGTVLLAVLPTVAGLAFNALYPRWLEAQGHRPVLFGLQIRQLLATITGGIGHAAGVYLENLVIIGVYLGLFLLPFLGLAFPSLRAGLSSRGRQVAWGVVLAGAGVGGALVLQGRRMPFIGNVLVPFGVGPKVLPGYDSFMGSGGRALIDGVWVVLTVLGATGAALLLLFGARAVATLAGMVRGPVSDRGWRLILVGGVAVLYVLAIAGLERGYWFDRYLIFLLPLAMAIASLAGDRGAPDRARSGFTATALIGLALAGSFTLAATHDYLAWNRARWRGLNQLLNEPGLSPGEIDGGFEFRGWHFGQRLANCASGGANATDAVNADWDDFRCLWPARRDEYPFAVGFLPRPGYEVMNEHAFRRWLPWRRQPLYVLRRLGPVTE